MNLEPVANFGALLASVVGIRIVWSLALDFLLR